MSDKWFVITGGPSSGISITAEHLATLGYHTVPEAARFFIDTEISKGRTTEEIRRDEIAFQDAVLKMKQEMERSIPSDRIVFFQRGIPDTLAYYRLMGADAKRIYDICKSSKYKKVFILENFPYKKDYARVEGEEKAKLIGKLLKEIYEELGFKVVTIPIASVEERVRMILSEIEKD